MSLLKPAYKIRPPAWMQTPELAKILDILNHDDINARMVGGCIRNHFFNKYVYDIDIACIFEPQKTISLLQEKGVRTIPTGIKHGTIAAHVNGHNFEITTLRQDTQTDGRHATVAFTDSWTEDAKRRDFTINALYADRDGSLYDPLGTGLSDIQNKIVRFIGNPDERIKEDYLRILRFFRFYAEYHSGEPDKEALQACTGNRDGLSTLSDERIADELFKILGSAHASKAITVMQDNHFFNLPPHSSEQIETLIHDQTKLEKQNILTRYNLLNIDKKYIKNNKQNKFIYNLNEFIEMYDGSVEKALYLYNREVVIQGLLTLKAQGQDIKDHTISQAMTLKRPEFPIVAADIQQAYGLGEGRDLGKKLKEAEKIWIESGFKLSRQDILARL